MSEAAGEAVPGLNALTAGSLATGPSSRIRGPELAGGAVYTWHVAGRGEAWAQHPWAGGPFSQEVPPTRPTVHRGAQASPAPQACSATTHVDRQEPVRPADLALPRVGSLARKGSPGAAAKVPA